MSELQEAVAELREWLGSDKQGFGGDDIDALYKVLDGVELAGILAEITGMSWVSEFQLIRRKNSPHMTDNLSRTLSDGRVHWWCWSAVIRGEQYAEMIWIPPAGTGFDAVGGFGIPEEDVEEAAKGVSPLVLLLRRARKCCGELEGKP